MQLGQFLESLSWNLCSQVKTRLFVSSISVDQLDYNNIIWCCIRQGAYPGTWEWTNITRLSATLCYMTLLIWYLPGSAVLGYPIRIRGDSHSAFWQTGGILRGGHKEPSGKEPSSEIWDASDSSWAISSWKSVWHSQWDSKSFEVVKWLFALDGCSGHHELR